MDTYVGIDIHKVFSQVHVQSQEGTCMEEVKLYHDDLEKMRGFFTGLDGDVHAAVEATVGWMWLADELQALGVDLHLTHQQKAKAISESRLKTDSVDARTLCHLLRTDFLPEAYLAPPAQREFRMLLRYRIAMVEMRTAVKNSIHAILIRYNIQNPFSDLFGKAGRDFLAGLKLPDVASGCLDGWLELLDFLQKQIDEAEKRLYEHCDEQESVKYLISIPGIAQLTAHLLLAEIGDISRFCRPKKLVSYAGLAPSVHQSASTRRTGRTGGGRKYLRWGLVEASRTACWKDPWLANFYNRKKRQKGSGKATVAVARKLATIVWHVLTEQRLYRAGNVRNSGSARLRRGGQGN